MLDLLRIMVLCGTLLAISFLVLLALPKSRLRCFVLEVAGWSMTGLSVIYIVSPIDLIPDFIPVLGQLDDVGALVAGIVAVITAISARRDRGKPEITSQARRDAKEEQASASTSEQPSTSLTQWR